MFGLLFHERFTVVEGRGLDHEVCNSSTGIPGSVTVNASRSVFFEHVAYERRSIFPETPAPTIIDHCSSHTAADIDC